MTHKYCPRCKTHHSIEDFYKNASNKKDGKSNYCKSCTKGIVSTHYRKKNVRNNSDVIAEIFSLKTRVNTLEEIVKKFKI